MTNLQKRLLEKNGLTRKVYVRLLIERIRERYSESDEFAILRKKLSGTNLEEFDEYNAYVERCKAELKDEFGI